MACTGTLSFMPRMTARLPLRYQVSETSHTVLFTEDVVKHFRRHRQRWSWCPEAGGQLFAKLSPAQVEICKATGPYRNDTRGRYFFRPDRGKESSDIEECFRQGLHYVGDWHTHPQKYPEPSAEDLVSIADSFKKSTHELLGFLLVIVGTTNPPGGLWVGWHDGKRSVQLLEDVQRGAKQVRS